jgi:hypothetical protein
MSWHSVKEAEINRSRSCPVCLEAYAAGETVRTVPCLHQFHIDCIDGWLQSNGHCPVCKFPATG